MTEPRFAFAIDPDRGPCHVGQLREYLDGSRLPRTSPLRVRTDGRNPSLDGPLDTAVLPTIGSLAGWLLRHDTYDTVYLVNRSTGQGWRVLPDDSYETAEGLVLVAEKEG